jgi:hypothetical protein
VATNFSQVATGLDHTPLVLEVYGG